MLLIEFDSKYRKHIRSLGMNVYQYNTEKYLENLHSF